MKHTLLAWLFLGLLAGCGAETSLGETRDGLGADGGADEGGDGMGAADDDVDDGSGADDDMDVPDDGMETPPDDGMETPSDDGMNGDEPTDDGDMPSDDGEDTPGDGEGDGTDGMEPADDDMPGADDDVVVDEGPCAGARCGDPCMCSADGQCDQPAFCDATGECVAGEVDCGGDQPSDDCACSLPAVCRLCDDGTCASASVECREDGSCTEPVFECTGDEERRCPASCPVPRICQPCGDGCADPVVHCNDDGSCGEIDWVCKEEPEGSECPGLCPVPAICHVCDDDTCATANVSCNADGSCGDIVAWECPAPKAACESDDECSTMSLLVACETCADGSFSCPSSACVEGECALEFPPCPDSDYDPCEGKSEGESCSLCPPDATDCFETTELKTCQDGECQAAMDVGDSG